MDSNDFIIYVGVVDINGYFLIYNKKFVYLMIGNYDVDLVKSRIKCIFNDYIGFWCGKNIESFLL